MLSLLALNELKVLEDEVVVFVVFGIEAWKEHHMRRVKNRVQMQKMYRVEYNRIKSEI